MYFQGVPVTTYAIGQMPSVDNFATKTEDLTNYAFGHLDITKKEEQKVKVCNNGDCCELTVEVASTANTDMSYKLVVRSGTRYLGRDSYFTRTCGLVSCQTNETSTCGKRIKAADDVFFKKMRLVGKFNSNQAFYFPSTLKLGLTPLPNTAYDYDVSTTDNWVTITMALNHNENGLLTFGIFGKDDSLKSSGLSTQANMGSILLVSLVAMYKYFF